MKLDVLPFALAALLAPPANAQTVKLSAPLAPEVRSGRVSDYLFTHDGTRVVYRDDRVQAFRFELFSRPLDGSAPSLRLNGTLHPQGSVGYSNFTSSFAVGAQDQVVYWADEVAVGVSELFSVPADGSASRIRISALGENVRFVRLDPAGTRAFYQDGGNSETFGPLRVVPVDGSAPPLQLTASDVRRFWLSPDGLSLVFAAAVPSASNRQDLFVMPSDGSAPQRFLVRTQPFPIGDAWFDDLVFTADGLRVVYNEHDWDDDDIRLYATNSVPLDGSAAPTQLVARSGYFGPFWLVPDAVPERVVYQAASGLDSKTTTGALATTLSLPGSTVYSLPLVVGPDVVFSGTSGSSSIFRVPADGSLLATVLCPGGSGYPLALANPTTVAFIGLTSNSYQLNAVPLAGGAALPLHPLPPPSQGTRWILPHPDGQRVLYAGDIEVLNRYELYVVPLDASQPPVKLSPPLQTGYVWDVQLTPDAMQVAFKVGTASGGPNELYLAPVDGSAPALHVNESVPSGNILGDVTSFQVTPDARGLVYHADLDADENFDLMSVDVHGVGRRLGDGAGSVLTSYELTPDSTRAVFQVSVGGERKLRVAGLADGAALTLDSGAQEFLAPYRFAAERLVYRRAVTAFQEELRSVALDGLSPPVVLHGPLATFARGVREFRVGAAGVVVFTADLVTDGAAELWATPLAGGVPPVRLSPALVSGGSVTSVELDASGTWAVFLADAHVNNRVELYSAPVDGSQRARRLNGQLRPPGDVMEFALTPDGESVIYRADQLADGRFDLFSVPLRGAPPPHARPGGAARPRATLLSAVPAGRSVQADWRLAPDGSQVVYRANVTAPGVLELLRAPVDGGTPPVVLSGALPPLADVTAFRVAPDQSRVAFVADARLDQVFEPFSAPLAGGAVVPLALLPSFAGLSELRIEPSSHDLVYTAAAESAGRVELYRVPLDGSAPSRRLNPTPTPGGDVLTDFLPLPLGVLYRADQQRDDVFELYFSF